MGGPEGLIVRDAVAGDAEALAAIYEHHVLHGLGTFEEVPPRAEEMDARRRAVQDQGCPYLVAGHEGRIVGFAYAVQFRPRAAYRYSVEDSIYVAHDVAGHGIGRTLLSALIGKCERLGKRQMVAVIGDSANAASIGLHAALGFERTGLGRSLGFKFGRWVDIVWMQRPLNAGDSAIP